MRGKASHSSTFNLNVSTFCAMSCVVTMTQRLRLSWKVDECTLVHFTSQREQCLWDTLRGFSGFSDKNGSG